MSELAEVEYLVDELARQVAAILEEQDKKIVFAESCTGGKMAAAMVTVPGISAYFCGSAVTYRESTKTQWLSVSESEIAQHTAESERITLSMAENVLAKTPEADYCIAITGHLGPGVDSSMAGKVFVTTGKRDPDSAKFVTEESILHHSDRKTRQAGAAICAFDFFLKSMR